MYGTLLWMALAGTAVAQSQAVGPAKPLGEDAPYQRVLTGPDAKRVAQLEKMIDELQAVGKFAETLGPAREVLEIRKRVQGAKHSEVVVADLQVRALAQMAALPAEDQVQLVTAQKLLGEGASLNERGRYDQAETPLRKALAIRHAVLGEDHRYTAESYSHLAYSLNAQGKHAEAEPLFHKALDIYRQALGEDHPDTAACYSNVAYNLDTQGKYAEAEAQYQKAMTVCRRMLGEDHAYTAISYNNLAGNRNAQGKYAEAEPLYHKALAVRRRVLGEDHPDTAQSYNNIAFNLDNQGKYAEAEPLCRKALAVRRRVLGEDHPDTAQSYNNIAFNLNAQGKYAEAKSLLQQVLAIYRRVLGEDHPLTARSYNNLAANLNAQGKYAEAEPLFLKALAVRRRVLGEDHPDTAGSYNTVAHSLKVQGKYAEAEPLFHKALNIYRRVLGEDHSHTAGIYNNVAANLNAQGKYAKAEENWSKAAQSFARARLGISFAGLDRTTFATERSPLSSLAAVLARRGKAEPAWQQLEANLARGLLDDLSARLARPLTAEERQREQRLIGRLNLLDRQIAALLGAKEVTDASRQQADRLQQQRDTARAEFTEFEAELAKPEKYGPAAGKVYDLQTIQSHLPAWAALLAWLDLKGDPKAADPNGEHWACVVRQRCQPVWVKLTGSGPNGAWIVADDDRPEQIRKLLVTKPEEATTEWRQQTGRLYKQRLAPLARHLSSGQDLPAIRHLIILPSASMAGVSVEALIEARTDNQPPYTVSYAPSATMFAWLQEQRQKAQAKGLGGRAARLLALGDPAFERPDKPSPPAPPPPDHGVLITQVVPESNAARGGLQHGDVVLTYAGTKLSGPADLEPAIKKSNDAPPAGAPPQVARIPLNVWRAGQRLVLTVHPGPLGVRRSDQPAAEAIRAGREADALVQRSRGEAYVLLPGTRREVEAIARLFPKAVTLLGSQASEQELDKLAASGGLREFDVVHLATHGVVNRQVAMLSALILAQDQLPDPLERVLAGQPAYNGRLTAEQILHTWKLDADLVTLSACDTGLGKYSGGEGYLGFAQALFLAGARSLVLSQWPVDDTATALLMTRFYQNLLGTRNDLDRPLPKAEALHEAKRWLRTLTFDEREQREAELSRGQPRKVRTASAGAHPYEHPHYWAGFILVGDPK